MNKGTCINQTQNLLSPILNKKQAMTDTEQQHPASGISLQSIMQEPTVHFVLIAALIFGLYAFGQMGNENVLEIRQRDIDARILLQEISTGEELNEEQRQLVAANYIQEQILVREAQQMELDNDERIHDILAQKMLHVLSGNIIQPSADELSRYYQQNRLRYETLSTLTADELVFNTREELSPEVIFELVQRAEPQALLEREDGTVSILPNVNPIDLANIFEAEFADNVFAAEIDDWTGPFLSNRGQHWLRVRSRTESRIPPLEEIADQVRLEWLMEEEEIRLQEEVNKLWEQYSIIIINDDEA